MGCQEYYQNSVLFSQFLLNLWYANDFIPYLLIFLTISDHQQEQETRILVSSTATNMSTLPNCHHTPDQLLNWNDLQRSVWNGSRLPIVTGDEINWYRADKRRTDRTDSDHHMIDRSTPVLHLWPNKNKHGLCTLNYYYIYHLYYAV